MYGRFLGLLIALMLWQNCVWAAPFRTPGEHLRGPSASGRSSFRPNNIPQRPQKQQDHSQDVEFRGYFYLNGMPRFCIYNVEAQFSEWITLGEATFEEFNASGFDLDSETLTVTFKNQSFNLNLYGPTSSPPSGPSGRTPPHPRTSKAPGPSQPTRMPPVPKFVPQLPAAVTSSVPPPAIPLSQQVSSSGNRAPPPSGSSFPGLPGPVIPGPMARPSSPVSSPNATPPSSVSAPAPPAQSFAPAPTVSQTPLPGSNPNPGAGEGTEIDFSNLPPPPPPPNILPPSAPPNIQPSRETE
ncbi:hypothetical protein OAK38_06640 [Verrucomicrobia bacterium]|nr:hypothetical protein [Verrucomicrobiota bacterium]